MTPNEIPTVRRWLNDVDRDSVLKLVNCGLSSVEIATITHISKSSINNIRQAYNACIEQDWSTLQRLSTTIRPTVDWAMRVTGADKVFAEIFHQDPKPGDEPKTQADPAPVPDPITREDYLAMYATMQDIRALLIEIRDTLK